MKKWSGFNYKFEIGEKVILFNTLNEGVVELDKYIYDKAFVALDNKQSECADFFEFSELSKMGFIVDKEKQEFRDYYNSMLEGMNKSDSLYITIMTTTSCNFTCSYCYENGIDKQISISDNVIEELCKYMSDYILANNTKNVYICLFGGEPTLFWEKAIEALKKIKIVCEVHNTILSTSILTNGFLLDKQKIMDLLPFNFSEAKITLDGTKEYHDARRRTADHKATFDTIFSNLKEILENSNARIALSTNCDKYNAKSIPALIKEIHDNLGNERVGFHFRVLSDSLIETKEDVETNNYIHSHTLSEDEYIKNTLKISDILNHYGFETPDFYSYEGLCMAKNKHSFILHPNGDIYKCISLVGRSNYSFGNIEDFKGIDSHFLSELFEECIEKECCFLPLCNTGCRSKSITKHGDISKIVCDKTTFEEINKKIIHKIIVSRGVSV